MHDVSGQEAHLWHSRRPLHFLGLFHLGLKAFRLSETVELVLHAACKRTHGSLKNHRLQGLESEETPI